MKNAFIVAYIASWEGRQVTGNIDFSTDADFISRQRTTEMILQKNAPGTHSVVVTNIIRLTPEEFNVWRGANV